MSEFTYYLYELCRAQPSTICMDKEAPHRGLLPALLAKVKDKELRAFILSYAKSSADFETEFLLHFADRLKISGMEKYQVLMQQIIQPGSGGFEHNESLISDRLNRLLGQAASQMAVKNYLDPFYLAVTLITMVHPLLPAKPTSGPVIENMISAFSLLDDIVHLDAGPGLKEALFEASLREAVKVEYRRTGLDDRWFSLLLAASNSDADRQRLLLHVFDRLIHETVSRRKESNNEFYEEYLLRKKMQLLLDMGKGEEANKVLLDHLRIRSFRMQLIDDYISKGDFTPAKELIKESKRSDLQKGRLNVSAAWDELLLRIAKAEQDVHSIRQTGMRLFYDQFNMEWYHSVKATFDQEKWKSEVEKIINTLRAEKHFGLKGIQAIASILAAEGYWERLLQLLQKNASLEFIEGYFDLLKDKFPHEIVEIYRVALRRYAEQHLGREHYEYLVKTLLKIQSLPSGVQAAKSLATEFKVKYSQRRNLVKALNKLVF